MKYILSNTTDNDVPISFIRAAQDITSDENEKRSRRRPRAVLDSPQLSRNSSSSVEISVKKAHVTTNSNASSTPVITNNIVILPTSLLDEQNSELERFNLQYTCKIVNKFSTEVTHVIVNAGRDRIFQSRTMKYFQGLASNKNNNYIHRITHCIYV